MQAPFYILGRTPRKGGPGRTPRSPLSTHTSLGLVVIGGHLLSRHRRRSSERSTSAIGAPLRRENQSRTQVNALRLPRAFPVPEATCHLSPPASLAVPGRALPRVPTRQFPHSIPFPVRIPVTRGFPVTTNARKETAHHTQPPGGLTPHNAAANQSMLIRCDIIAT
jgi:hypothetical protein